MKNAKILITAFAAAWALGGPLAAGATPAPQRLAQANPTGDPDVQRGINERNEQERQKKN